MLPDAVHRTVLFVRSEYDDMVSVIGAGGNAAGFRRETPPGYLKKLLRDVRGMKQKDVSKILHFPIIKRNNSL